MLVFIVRIALLTSLPIALVACNGLYGEKPASPETARHIAEIAKSPETLSAYFADTTTKSYFEEHGTQIEYLSPQGTAHLAYPGNRNMVVGEWKTRESPSTGIGSQLCFQYGKNTYNPATNRRGGSWECRQGFQAVYFYDEVYDGDPLGMRNVNRLPQVMPKGVNVSISEVMTELGIEERQLRNKVTWDWRPD